MVVQLLVALVEAIRRQEERDRIGNVNGHRQVERRARLPHRIEPRVVDLHESSRRSALAQVEAERLQHLQSASAGPRGPFDLGRLELRVRRLVRA